MSFLIPRTNAYSSCSASSSFDNFGTASAELTYSEAPVIVYTPVGGEQLARRLLQPVGLDTIDLLTRAGWDMDRILWLCVQEINHVWNAESATGPMSSRTTPDYETFRRVARTLNELESKRLITFPVHHYEDGHPDNTYIPGQQNPVMAHVMIIDTDAKQRPEVKQLMTDLSLDPQADSNYITNR